MQTEIKEPLYKRLNKERQKGTFEAVEFDMPHKDICIKMSELKTKDGKNWNYADRVCEHFNDLETAQYTALSVNNLHVLAEALEAFVNDIEGHPSYTAAEHYKPLMDKAKEALNKIS